MTVERKLLTLPISLPEEGRTIVGHASVFNVLDSYGDIVLPGAFNKTLQERGAKIRVLWQHDTTKPIALPSVLREDERGLYFEATIEDTRDGEEALDMIRRGLVTGVSIGFTVVRYTVFEDDDLRAQLTGWARWKEMRKLEEVKLYELSPVTFPANEAAQIIAVKSALGWSPASASVVDEGRRRRALDSGPAPGQLDPEVKRALDELASRFEVTAAREHLERINNLLGRTP